MNLTAEEVIAKLELIPLPEEGGFYRETYRDPGVIASEALPHHDGDRSYSTCIYYLITPEEFSGLHAVKSTEIFHFYAGDPVEMIQIDSHSELNRVVLGSDLSQNQNPQVVVPKEIWQGTRLIPGGKWALLGCTVAPGFEFSDFIGGDYESLSERFPMHQEWIRKYTHR